MGSEGKQTSTQLVRAALRDVAAMRSLGKPSAIARTVGTSRAATFGPPATIKGAMKQIAKQMAVASPIPAVNCAKKQNRLQRWRASRGRGWPG